MGTKTGAKTEKPKAEEPEDKGGNGEGTAEPEGPAPKKKVELSPEVVSWLPYCGQPLTVHLKFGLVLMDCTDEMEMPVDAKGRMGVVGIAGPAKYRDPETAEKKEGIVTDTIERVVMQPAPCGQRLLLLHRTDERTGQSGAMIAYAVRPEDIWCVSQVAQLPQRMQRPEGRRIIAPGM